MDISQRLKTLRTTNGISQDVAAEVARVSKSAYLHWEYGKRRPSLDGVILLARHYGITVDELISGERHIESHDNFTDEERELIESYRRLDKSARITVLTLVMRLWRNCGDLQSAPNNNGQGKEDS